MLLASLFLPWQTAQALSLKGWSADVGAASALASLLLAALAATALARPNLLDRLPLGACALLAGYSGLGVAVVTRSYTRERGSSLGKLSYHYAYGAYLGVAAAVVLLVVAGALVGPGLWRARSPLLPAAVLLGIALLVSFLFPWMQIFPGIAAPAGVVAAGVTLCLLATPANRLVLSVMALLFTVAAFTSVAVFGFSHADGAWIGVGLAVALVVAAVAGTRGLPSHEPPRGRRLAAVGAAALLIAGLFLPWQRECFPTGGCISANGWTTPLGATAALLALGLLILFVSPRRFLSRATVGVGIALLIATVGFQLESQSGLGLHIGYGAIIGFVAAGLLLALALAGVRRPNFDARIAPIAACVAYLAVIVVPWWSVLPAGAQSALHFAPESWVTIAGVLLAIWLVQLWLVRGSASAEWLVIVPLAMLALAALDLIGERRLGLSWARAAVVVLCLALAVLGRLERREGLGRLRVPKTLRLDRL